MVTKQFWASKTLWVNALSAIAAITGAVGIDLGLTPEVQAQVIVGIMALVNIGLRFVTSSGLKK